MKSGDTMKPSEIVMAFIGGESMQGLSLEAENVIREELVSLNNLIQKTMESLSRMAEALKQDAYDQMAGFEAEEWSRWYSTGFAHGKVGALLAFEHATNLVSVYSLQQAIAFSQRRQERLAAAAAEAGK